MAARKLAGPVGGGVDEQGVATLIQPWHCDTIGEAFSVGEPSLFGLPYRDRQFGIWNQDTKLQGYQIGLRYEGITSEMPEDVETWDYDGEFTKENIDSFPKLQILKDDWGAYIDDAGHVKFAPKLSKEQKANQKGAGGFSKGNEEGEDDDNPMFGQDSYPLFHAVYARTYIKRSFPFGIFAKIGRIYKDPPGAQETPEGREWLFDIPRIRGRGNVVEVTEFYKLSPPGGWPPHITILYQGNFGK